MPSPGDICFYRGGNDFWSRVVRRWTGSPYSHCGVVSWVHDDGSYETIEAVTAGVSKLSHTQIDYDAVALTSAAISAPALIEGLAWLQRQLGTPYNYADIADQPLRKFFHWAPLIFQPRSYDCSDLCAHFLLVAAFEAVAGQRAQLMDSETISPGQLARILKIL